MDHNLFIYSFISGHLDCFHLLAIVNNAAMNIGGLLRKKGAEPRRKIFSENEKASCKDDAWSIISCLQSKDELSFTKGEQT